MTRAKAIAATWALTNIDGFDEFVAEVKEAWNRAEGSCHMSPEFYEKLSTLLEEEYRRLEQVLEEL